MTIRIVTATRQDSAGFRTQTLLGSCIATLQFRQPAGVEITFNNTSGLPKLYNAALSKADDADIMIFIHDDVWINDFFLETRLEDGLSKFDIIGVAGNRKRALGQPMWAYRDAAFTWDERLNLSGAIAGLNDQGAPQVSHYGQTPSEVKLLDGVFLATRAGTLRKAGVQFDSRFTFHFYDMDFCRTCEQAGLRLGTWPIALTHASGGNHNSLAWQNAYALYREKWAE